MLDCVMHVYSKIQEDKNKLKFIVTSLRKKWKKEEKLVEGGFGVSNVALAFNIVCQGKYC